MILDKYYLTSNYLKERNFIMQTLLNLLNQIKQLYLWFQHCFDLSILLITFFIHSNYYVNSFLFFKCIFSFVCLWSMYRDYFCTICLIFEYFLWTVLSGNYNQVRCQHYKFFITTYALHIKANTKTYVLHPRHQ